MLIRAGDSKYGAAFERVAERADIEVVKIAPCAPRTSRCGLSHRMMLVANSGKHARAADQLYIAMLDASRSIEQMW